MQYTSANLMTKTKIERNKLLQTLLGINIKIAKLEMIIKMRFVTYTTGYIESLKKINEIEKKQLNEYCINRERLVNYMVDALNKNDFKFDDLKLDIIKLKDCLFDNLSALNYLNQNIPTTGIITNFKEL